MCDEATASAPNEKNPPDAGLVREGEAIFISRELEQEVSDLKLDLATLAGSVKDLTEIVTILTSALTGRGRVFHR